jgi:hypothetical protein
MRQGIVGRHNNNKNPFTILRWQPTSPIAIWLENSKGEASDFPLPEKVFRRTHRKSIKIPIRLFRPCEKLHIIFWPATTTKKEKTKVRDNQSIRDSNHQKRKAISNWPLIFHSICSTLPLSHSLSFARLWDISFAYFCQSFNSQNTKSVANIRRKS